MTETRVHQLLSLINQQITSRQNLNKYLSKIKALSCVALQDSFLSCPESVQHDYLWTLTDIVDEALELNEQWLSVLLKNLN